MSSASAHDGVKAIFGAFDAVDVASLAAQVTDDVTARLGNAQPMEGKAAFVEAVDAFVASVAHFRHEIIDVWSDGDVLIAELEVHYRRLDGKEVTIPGCNVFRLRDGLVASYRSYIDTSPVYT